MNDNKMNDNNMNLWNSVSSPDPAALKVIEKGRLSGKLDINPQWRVAELTRQFGVCGIGWKYTIDREWRENLHNDEVIFFCHVSLYVKIDGEWSAAIPSIGSKKLTVNESKGLYNDEDAAKKSVTDALGKSASMLGVAANVYLGIYDGRQYGGYYGLVGRYNALLYRALASGMDVDGWALTENMTYDDIKKLGRELNQEMKMKGKKRNEGEKNG